MIDKDGYTIEKHRVVWYAEIGQQARIVLEEQTSSRKNAYCFKIPVEGGEAD